MTSAQFAHPVLNDGERRPIPNMVHTGVGDVGLGSSNSLPSSAFVHMHSSVTDRVDSVGGDH